MACLSALSGTDTPIARGGGRLMKWFTNLSVQDPGSFTYENATGGRAAANFPLFLIKEAWKRGMWVDDLADGFGEGKGTMGGDWSGVRDSSDEAKEAMLERALNFMFFDR